MLDAPPLRPTTVRRGVLALACGASFLLYLHRYTWNIVGPELQADHRLSNAQAGLLFSLFYYTYASGQVPAGVVVDRFGPRRFLGACLVLWSLALAALGQASRLWVLGALRLGFGAAQAGGYPALTAVTRSWFPPGRRTVMQGWIATASGRAGGALAPLLLGTVLMGGLGLSWRAGLAVLGAMGVGYGLLFWAVFRDTPAEHPGVNEAERALIEPGPAASDPPGRPRSALPARRALGNVSLRSFAAQQFLDAGSDVVFVGLIGTYFLRARGFDVAKTGWLASLPLWGGALGGIAGGWLNDRLIAATGSRRWARSGVGFAGKAVGCGLLLLVPRLADGLAVGLLLMAAKFFSDWSQPTTWGACTDLGGRYSATVFSLINTAGTLGGVVMPPVFGAVLDAFTRRTGDAVATDWQPLFLLVAAMYLGSGLCWLAVDCTRTLDDGPASA